jgi:hypothetical protein
MAQLTGLWTSCEGISCDPDCLLDMLSNAIPAHPQQGELLSFMMSVWQVGGIESNINWRRKTRFLYAFSVLKPLTASKLVSKFQMVLHKLLFLNK